MSVLDTQGDAQTTQEQRQAAADLMFESHDIESEAGLVEDASGWESEGNVWSRTLYFANTQYPDGPTVKGHFEITFKDGCAEIMDGHACVTGKPEPASGLSM